MNLISLNTWGGKAGRENLLDFFKTYRDVDIFCLQEMWEGGEHMNGKIAGKVLLEGIMHDGVSAVARVLPEHVVHFRPHYGDWYGLALFIKKNIPVTEEGEMFVYKDKGYASRADLGDHARNIQYVTYESSNGPKTVVNFHGLWNGQGKGDSDERITQSDNILRFLKNLNNPVVLAGDLNLLPETESLRMLENFGLKNLIKEYGITSTRTKFYTKPEKFADYVLVSADVRVTEFKILPEEVSDHAAMYLDLE